jgi:hypothetical protein
MNATTTRSRAAATATTGATTATAATSQTRAMTVATRFAAEIAKRELDAARDPDRAKGGAEFDDGSRDAPLDYRDDEDGGLLDRDDRDLRPPVASRLPWAELAIYLDDGVLGYAIRQPAQDRADVQASYEASSQWWEKVARRLMARAGQALRCPTPLAALHALDPTVGAGRDKPETERWTRQRHDLVITPFGRVPLWFFLQGRADRLFSDLERLGRAVIAEGLTALGPETIARILPHAAIRPDSIRRSHAPTLLAIAGQPDVVSRHRALWPCTTMADLKHDLGLGGRRQGASDVAAALALAGAFDPPNLVGQWSVQYEPRREVLP